MIKFEKKAIFLITILLFTFVLCGAVTAASSTQAGTTVQSKTTINGNSTVLAKTATGSTYSATYTSKTTTTKTSITSKSTQPTFTIDQINLAATKTKNFINTNHRLPNYVTINGIQVSMAPFLHLLTNATIQIQTGKNNPIVIPIDTLPPSSSEDLKTGTLTKAAYVDFAYRISDYMNKTHQAPPYGVIGLGKVSYKTQIYMFSRILDFYTVNKRLPYTVSVAPFNSSKTSTGSANIKNLAYYQQPNSYSCGPSSLKMVLSAYGLNVDEKWLETAAGTTSTNGTSHAGIINALQVVNKKYGTHFTAWDETLSTRTWNGLYSQFISQNMPVILHVKSWLIANGGHYVVLVGLNLSTKMATLADPSYGGYRIDSFTDLETRMNWIISSGRSSNPIIAIKNNT